MKREKIMETNNTYEYTVYYKWDKGFGNKTIMTNKVLSSTEDWDDINLQLKKIILGIRGYTIVVL